MEYIHLDLGDQQSIRHFADVIQKRGLEIDCLINNAGVMWLNKHNTKQHVEMHFGVNYLGHFLLTILLLPHMKQNSRILMLGSITSLFGKIPFDDINLNKNYNKFEAYANSKLAICHFAQSLAKRLEKSGKNISVFYVNPGSATTEITKTLPYILQFLYKTVGRIIFKTPFQGACCSIYAAISDELDGKNGLFLYECRPQENVARSLPIYNEEREMLWQLSEKLTSSQYPF
uniref:Uncharacterized protein n=1 Tax=Arcella intermedia TaxID=1963864 RepID=A0A6B2LCT8_9EUKA